jgi:peptide/nickel transport system permease protein
MSDTVLKVPEVRRAGLNRSPAGPGRRPSTSIRAGRVLFWLACSWLLLLVIVAAGAALLPLRPYDVPVTGLPPRTAPLSGTAELLGTDGLGRSMASRLVYGARQSLLVGGGAVAVSMLVGLVLGVVAGYLRGTADAVLRVLLDAQLSIPPLVLLLAVSATGRRTVWTVAIGLALVGIPTFARLARAQTLAVVNLDYVVAARAMGAGHLRVIIRELLPGVVMALLTYAFLHMGLVIVAEGSLSFLGLGIPPPSPSWGGMVSDGRRYLATEPFLVFVPAACLVLTVLSFTLIGDRVRRLLDAREAVPT